MTYVKKSVYGAALLEIVNSNLRRQDVINQDGNTLRLEGQDIAPQYLDVGALYATEQMRK